MIFIVIDEQTGKQITVEDIFKEEPDWMKQLTYTRASQLEFALGQEGDLYLIDCCGNWVNCPPNFKAILSVT